MKEFKVIESDSTQDFENVINEIVGSKSGWLLYGHPFSFGNKIIQCFLYYEDCDTTKKVDE